MVRHSDGEESGPAQSSAVDEMQILWLTAGLGCDGDTIALTAATQPSIEELLLGGIPGLPAVKLHNPFLAVESGEEFLAPFRRAATGELGPFILVVEGSIPNEEIKAAGYWAAMGTDPTTGQPITTCEWIDRIAPHAWAVLAAGTCSAYGGIHAMAGNPTGAMGLPDYLGWNWRSAAGMPIVCLPGCPTHPDSLMETIMYLLSQAAGRAPMIPLDQVNRPTWLFGQTVHEGCDRGGYYEQADFAGAYGSPKCVVKLGCWGPVVTCNVPKRGWINGVGGCPNVGGLCIGCTMPGFPDKFMPFMDEPPGAKMSTAAVLMYGRTVRSLRNFTRSALDKEPDWRNPRADVQSPRPETRSARGTPSPPAEDRARVEPRSPRADARRGEVREGQPAPFGARADVRSRNVPGGRE
jgi:hydrogenase small subunit